jgi:hypothetical protein
VLAGPDQGTSFRGTLAVQVSPTGVINGLLTLANGSTAPVIGKVGTQTLYLAFQEGGQSFSGIFGTQSGLHGRLLGPRPGDVGVLAWYICIGIRLPNGTCIGISIG